MSVSVLFTRGMRLVAASLSLALLGSANAAPANDNFVDANVLSGTSATVAGSNVGATKEVGEPDHAQFPGGKSVWYAWTSPFSASVRLSTKGSAIDTLLAAYTGSAVNALTPIASNDDEVPSLVITSKVSFEAVAGTTYYIAVDGFLGEEGNLTFSLAQPVNFIGVEGWTNGPYFGTRGTFFADVDGDGLTDAIVVNDGGITVRRSNGSRFTANQTWAGAFFGTRGTFFADVTGDNRADAIAVNDSGITVCPSNGTVFSPCANWSNNPFFGDIGTYFADVNGDNRADVIAVNASGITVRAATGTIFGAPQVWSGPFFGNVTAFADATGDGLADAIAVNSTGITVRPSDGSVFGASEAWSTAFAGSLGTFFADVNGSGSVDAIAVNDTNITVRSSNGVVFGGNLPWTANPYFGEQTTAFADVTGDGLADAIVVNNSGISVRRAN